MNVIPSQPSKNRAAILYSAAAQKRRSSFSDDQRDHIVTGRLVFTSLTGLLAVFSAICTTMIELGSAWRYSWLAICIVLTVSMLVGICSVGVAIGKQPSPELRAVVTHRRPKVN